MPIHDWTRVSAGTFHDFHVGWIAHIKEHLNQGQLPEGYYAQAEQHERRGLGIVGDVLTLSREEQSTPPRDSGVATLDRPRVSRTAQTMESSTYRRMRRTLTVRHQSGHKIVALIEIISRSNKDRRTSVADFINKVRGALDQGIHVLFVDLFPPGSADPQGMHLEIWDAYDALRENEPLPLDKPLIAAAYEAKNDPEAYFEPLAVGDPMPTMPLFLDVGYHAKIPLATSYDEAYRGVPSFYRDILEGRSPPETTAK